MFLGWAFPLETFHGVVGDEVDECAEGFGALCEDASLVEFVIDAFDEDVLEGDALFALALIVVEGLEEFFDLPL